MFCLHRVPSPNHWPSASRRPCVVAPQVVIQGSVCASHEPAGPPLLTEAAPPAPLSSDWLAGAQIPAVLPPPCGLPPVCFQCVFSFHAPFGSATRTAQPRHPSPQAVFLASLGLVAFAKRFAVCQLDSKGASKLRCIDDFLQNRVNDACRICGRIRMDTLQDLYEVMCILPGAHLGCRAKIAKADFNGVYRQCPVHLDHYKFAGFCVADPGFRDSFDGTQYAMLFGAVAAVYVWDRLGAAVIPS